MSQTRLSVPFIDYPAQYSKSRTEILEIVDRTLSRGDVMLRQQLLDFEEQLARFVGTRYSVGTSNCTDALHLTLRAAGIGPGDEVITVSHTFVATAAAIHHAGATPILVDIAEDHNMDVDLLEAAVTARTRAIIPVHLNGRLCSMERVMAIAQRHDLTVIEDSAQALGGSFNGRKGGAWGTAGCFSFYPAKLLGAYGDAGALVTDDEDLAQSVRLLRNHGRTEDGDIASWSFNCRLDNLHAAILSHKLTRVPEWIERRRELASIYAGELHGIHGLILPPAPDESAHFDVFQNYEIEVEDRDGLRSHLADGGIETLIPWGGKGVHQLNNLGLTDYHLPRTDLLFRRALMLPLHCEMSDEQAHYVADSVKRFLVS